MKVFNPEKELRKIQHENKNKIIFGVIALLITIAIGSSYALYQVRYSKQIIYTKVAPFSIRDVILSVKVEGESTSRTSFPNQSENPRFVGLECDEPDITSGSWDYKTWSLNLNTKGPNKCTILFKKPKLFSEVIIADDISIFNDDYGNIRYAGPNEEVHNYIWFNCDDYDLATDNESASTKCERWRIIGLMNDTTIVNEETEEETPDQSLVKIIRDDSIGNMQCDSAGTNNWNQSSIQVSLNGAYYNGETLGNGKGITSLTQGMIENTKWYLSWYGDTGWTPEAAYKTERGTSVASETLITWNGKIALMYPSDYGYASTGDTEEKDRTACLTKTGLHDYYLGCYKQDWIFKTENQWTITPDPDGYQNAALFVASDGHTHYGYNAVTNNYSIRPTLYLKSNVKILDGNGTFEEPYIIK